MNERLPLREAEPTLELIRELRDAELLTEGLIARALKAKRPARPPLDPRTEPHWDDLQIITAQLAVKPQLEEVPVTTELTLGVGTRKRPLTLSCPLLVPLSPVGAALRRLTIGDFGLQLVTDDDSASSDPDAVRALCVNRAAISQYRDRIREAEVPVGIKVSVDHVEQDVTEALAVGANFIVVDAGSRGIRALSAVRSRLAESTMPSGFAVIIAGDLQIPNDFIKALALGADAVAVSPSIVDRILKLPKTMEHTGLELVSNFVHNAMILMKVMTRACGHTALSQLNLNDLTTWREHVATTSGVACSGHGSAA